MSSEVHSTTVKLLRYSGVSMTVVTSKLKKRHVVISVDKEKAPEIPHTYETHKNN